MPVGHTKFSCDWAFGLLKRKFRCSYTSSLADLVEVVNTSTPASKVNFAVLTGTEDSQVLVKVHDWQAFFTQQSWLKLLNITRYSHFEFSHEWKGEVKCRITGDPNAFLNTISKSKQVYGFPVEIIPEGLSEARKKYLFENIRPYCKQETKDLLCPKPITTDNDNSVNVIENVNYSESGPSTSMQPVRKGKRKIVNDV